MTAAIQLTSAAVSPDADQIAATATAPGAADPDAGHPVAWRVWWKPAPTRPFDRRLKPAAQMQTFGRKDDADACKRELDRDFASQGVACMTPLYRSNRTRERQRQDQQLSFDDLWFARVEPKTPA